jgi:hypothetical protein
MHFECRLRREALRAADIKDGLDITAFDHEAFWQQQLIFRGLSRKYSCRYLGGLERVLELWAETQTIQGMMLATRDIIVNDQRERTFPRKRLISTHREWQLVGAQEQDKLAHK